MKKRTETEKKKSEVDPSLSLLEIVRGYSIFFVNNKAYYFKHFSIMEMLRLDEFEKIELQKATSSGIQTEQQLIDSAIKFGSWSVKTEDQIKSLEWTINHSTKALSNITDPNQRKAFSGQIEQQRRELEEIRERRVKISGYSAEHLSQRKRFSEMVEVSLFYDELFEKPVAEKYKASLSPLVFSKFAELTTKENVLKASYLTYFFDVFATQSENPLALFGVGFSQLTVFQKNLLSYSKSLFSKLTNTQIPKEIYGDPVKMFDYEEPKDASGEKVTHGMDDVKRKMEARGGELKAEDLLG